MSKAILFIPCLSSAGPDGSHPHLKNKTGLAAGEGENILLKALTGFVNLILEGNASPPTQYFFFEATLIALGKDDSGIWPIAVECILHCLVAKCNSSSMKQAMAALLAPHQLHGFWSKPLSLFSLVLRIRNAA